MGFELTLLRPGPVNSLPTVHRGERNQHLTSAVDQLLFPRSCI